MDCLKVVSGCSSNVEIYGLDVSVNSQYKFSYHIFNSNPNMNANSELNLHVS